MLRRFWLAAMAGLLTASAGCAPLAAEANRPALAASAAAPIERISAMETAVDRALDMANRHGADRVLVVFDIDSTLLRDARGGPDLSALEEADPARFRQVERTVMYLSALEPTEPVLLDQLARLDAAGITTYALTARGTDMRDMTLRELEANRIAFPRAPECGPPLCRVRGNIPAPRVLDAAREAVGAGELERLGFTRGRLVSVSDGVVMASGLHKGVLLRALMASVAPDYAGVVFVDDAERNVIDVADASAAMDAEVAVFHYSGPPSPRARSRAEIDADWRAAETAICRAFAPRWCGASR